MLFGLAALAVILLLLHAAFGSFRLALLTFLLLPMALVGGVLAVWFGDGVLSLGSLVGFLAVFGIAARNGILMISHFQRLEREEGIQFGRDLVLQGAIGTPGSHPDDGAQRPAWRWSRWWSPAASPGTRSSIRWPSSSWVDLSPRPCSTSSSCRRFICGSAGPVERTPPDLKPDRRVVFAAFDGPNPRTHSTAASPRYCLHARAGHA